MRTLNLAAVLAAITMLTIPVPASAQSLYNGYRRIDPMGVDRPPAPSSRKRYKPVIGNYPPCRGFLWTGTRCRLPTGQVCTVYDFGLGACV
jgi:hypothetical protein